MGRKFYICDRVPKAFSLISSVSNLSLAWKLELESLDARLLLWKGASDQSDVGNGSGEVDWRPGARVRARRTALLPRMRRDSRSASY